jgi:hypothetical protein
MIRLRRPAFKTVPPATRARRKPPLPQSRFESPQRQCATRGRPAVVSHCQKVSRLRLGAMDKLPVSWITSLGPSRRKDGVLSKGRNRSCSDGMPESPMTDLRQCFQGLPSPQSPKHRLLFPGIGRIPGVWLGGVCVPPCRRERGPKTGALRDSRSDNSVPRLTRKGFGGTSGACASTS